jgi:hypothetical protein
VAFPNAESSTAPSKKELLLAVHDAWRVIGSADRQLVEAVEGAHRAGHTYRNLANGIIQPTGTPGVTNELRRRLANALKERVGRSRRATQHCVDLERAGRMGLHESPTAHHDSVMKEASAQVPYRRRVTEEWYDLPPSERAAGGDQDHDLDEDLDGPPQLLGDREALGAEERENAALGDDDDDDDLEGAED